ncbi:unnamed protein product [Acanthosepion pharaonis]|uniref:Uncharacterized protein n=1 Tax=Acanthosepion pharaonis TaxID=158019 RepID=A0A812DH39_ACAPH|nr:unnamed protein product [Sepia pharaonis]
MHPVNRTHHLSGSVFHIFLSFYLPLFLWILTLSIFLFLFAFLSLDFLSSYFLLFVHLPYFLWFCLFSSLPLSIFVFLWILFLQLSSSFYLLSLSIDSFFSALLSCPYLLSPTSLDFSPDSFSCPICLPLSSFFSFGFFFSIPFFSLSIDSLFSPLSLSTSFFSLGSSCLPFGILFPAIFLCIYLSSFGFSLHSFFFFLCSLSLFYLSIFS